MHQPPHPVSEVLHGASLCHRHVAPSTSRLAGEEQVAYAPCGIAVYDNGSRTLSHRLLGPAAKGSLKGSSVQTAEKVMQRGHARGLRPAEPKGLGELGVFQALLGDGVQTVGATQP